VEALVISLKTVREHQKLDEKGAKAAGVILKMIRSAPLKQVKKGDGPAVKNNRPRPLF